MSTASIKNRILRLESRRVRLLAEALAAAPMLRGSFSRVHTRCGKASCWCAHSEQGHPHSRITWSENGRLITRKVPPERIDRIIELTASHRRFRSRQRQLAAVDEKIRALLNEYETALSHQARKRLGLPDAQTQSSASTATTRRKRPSPNKSTA